MRAMLATIDAAEGAILDTARTVTASAIAPHASAVDEAEQLPHENLRVLAETGLLGLAVQPSHGGAGVSPRALRRFHGVLAEACGATAFVAIQHASACKLVAQSPSAALRDRLLPAMARGELLGAPAFSHLRRPGSPSLHVAEEGGVLVFDGVAPWVTGWGAIGVVALGGTLPDGRFLYAAVLPEETTGVKAWPPMRLSAMTASSTVSITFSRARVPRDNLLFFQTPEEAHAAAAAGTLNQAPCSLGVAAAAQKILAASARKDASLEPSARAFQAEIDGAWSDVETWADRAGDPTFPESALAVRARCVELGVRAALSAIVATGGTSLKRDRDPQRLYREAALYAVAPQTDGLRRATLARLVRRT